VLTERQGVGERVRENMRKMDGLSLLRFAGPQKLVLDCSGDAPGLRSIQSKAIKTEPKPKKIPSNKL